MSSQFRAKKITQTQNAPKFADPRMQENARPERDDNRDLFGSKDYNARPVTAPYDKYRSTRPVPGFSSDTGSSRPVGGFGETAPNERPMDWIAIKNC